MRGEGRSHQKQYLILILVMIASFVGALDSSIVNISLPAIAGYFHSGIVPVSWVAMAYLLTLTATLIAFGRLADIQGYRCVYLAGFGIFTLASFLCSISPTLIALIGSRIIQAFGAAMLQAIGGAMITRYLPEHERGGGFGIMATAVSLGVASGPVLGGFLTEYASWHWIFLVNIPVGITAILLGIKAIPADDLRREGSRFDLPGAGLLFLTLGSLLFFISLGGSFGYTSPLILGSLVLCAGSGVAFLLQERRFEYPLLDLSLFRNYSYSLGNCAGLITMLLVNGIGFLMPFFLEGVMHLPPSAAGMTMMIPAIALMVIGPLSGRISDRIGARPLCIFGSLLFVTAFLFFSRLDPSTSLPWVLAILAIHGTASGTMNPASLRLILGWSPEGREGEVNSTAMTMRNMGSVMGVAVFSAVFTAAVPGRTMGSTSAMKEIGGFQAAFGAGLLLAGFMLLFSLFARERTVP